MPAGVVTGGMKVAATYPGGYAVRTSVVVGGPMSTLKRVAVVALAVLALTALAACTPKPGLVDSAGFKKVQSSDARVIDVRTAEEFAGGHIDGAENVPISDLAVASRTWDPAKPVALYCATGSRSAEAADFLRSAGFKTVYDLKGGLVAWNGSLAGGSTAAPVTTTPSATGRPVMYEFYTDT